MGHPAARTGRTESSQNTIFRVMKLREAQDWLIAVFKAWYGWVGASATAGMLGLAQGLHLWQPDRRVYLGLMIIGLFVSCFLSWADEYRTKNAFLCPVFDLTVKGLGTPQRDSLLGPNFWDAVYWRIAVANRSEVLLKQCRVVLESWTFNSVGLNADTALSVKDETSHATDIPGNDRKQFNFLINVLNRGTDDLNCIRVQVPNFTFVSSPTGGYSATVRVSADNMNVKRYRVLLLVDQFGIRITDVVDVSTQQ